MYDYIIGKVTDIKYNSIVLENNNIGYLIFVANPYYFELDKEYTIYVYQYVREDENTLYGFKDIEEKKLFLKLIEVKGVGCKMALPMFATGSIDGITDAIERENILYFFITLSNDSLVLTNVSSTSIPIIISILTLTLMLPLPVLL